MAKLASKKSLGNGVEFDFGDKVFRVEIAEFNEDILHQAMIHGLSQKLGDSYAGALNVSEAIQRFTDTLESLRAGTWNSGRTGMGGDLAQAIANLTSTPVEDIAEALKGKDKKELANLRKQPEVAAEILKIKLEREKSRPAKVDANAKPLAELLGLKKK